MLTTMKNYFILFYFIFLFSMTSCQTTKGGAEDSQQDAEGSAAGDLIEGGADVDEEDEDLESEFADSEDLEQEMAEEAFPSEEEEGEQAEQTEEAMDEELGGTEEFVEDATQKTEEQQEKESVVEVEDMDELLESEGTSVADENTGSSASGTGVVINNIRYESGENKIYIDGTGSFSYQSRENKSNNQVVIEIPGAILSESLQERPFIMKDFNTEMALLQADQKDSNTVRIVVQMRGNAGMPSISVSETGSLVIAPDGMGMVAGGGESQPLGVPVGEEVPAFDQKQSAYGGGGSANAVLPAKSLEEFFLHTPQFTGRPISIHLRDVSVRDVLYFISEGTGLNMVLSDDVAGNISIKLRNVPWDQALVTVMKTKKLGYLREGNVIRIMSLESLKKDQEDIKKMMESQKILDPLKVKVIPLIYTKASSVDKQLEGLTTKRGRIVVDNQSNSLIITDTSRVIERIETMIKNLDKSPLQVLIEAKIIEARERFVRNLGINWRYDGVPLSYAPGGNSQLALNVDGSLEAFPGNVNTGRTVSSGLSVSFAPLGDLDITLGLSEAEDLIHVISAPRIVVLNGETAKITQRTQDIDLVTNTAQGGSTERSPQRVSADLGFEVVPQITALGSVFMNVKMKRDFFGPPDAESGSRPINSREAETRVLVNNGQTIVIGGIYQRDESRSDEGIPILRHIPVLKWLFSRFTTDEQRNELLLFLTPKVMEFAPPENKFSSH